MYTAVVTPLFKNKGDKNDTNSYRGISVLPSIAKLFEKILAYQIIIFLNVNNLLFKGQHGFRSHHSCETALHELLSEINTIRDKRLICLLLFIDFRKAFDLVDSSKLIRKLFHLGFDNNALELIKNYFEDREQTVKFNNKNSTFQSINLGVPQGSVLGPLFFLIFINDLAFILDLMCKMFADDTTLYDKNSDLDSLIRKFKHDLDPLINWCKYNKLDLNWSKTYFMFITNKRIKNKLPKHITIDGNDVEVVESFKLLGVTIDNKLTFSKYCSDVKKNINIKIFSIKRLFYLSTAVKIQFFKTFVMPYFDYCLSILIYFPKIAIQKLSNCFNNCLYNLFKFKIDVGENETASNEHINDFNNELQKYGLFSFQHRLLNKILAIVHEIKTNEKAPPLLKNMLVMHKDSGALAPNTRQLRNRIINIEELPSSKFFSQTFSYVSKIILCNFNNFDLSSAQFKEFIVTDMNLHLSTFSHLFSNFNIQYSSYCTNWKKFHQKKNLEKTKRKKKSPSKL